MIQGTFEGHFTYTSSEPQGLTLEGGYVAGCASRIVEPSTTALDGLDAGPVLILRADQEGPVTLNTITGNIGTGMRVELYNNSDTAKISNNIIWNNSGPSGGDLFLENDGNGDGQPSRVDLLPSDFDQSQIVIPLPFPIDPSNLNHIDPAVVSANLDDYHLQVGSPVIDQGDNSAPGLPLTDQEGHPRILQGTVDLGVFEFGVTAIVHITRAAFINHDLFLLISASSSAAPTAQLFVTVSPRITNAPMTLQRYTYLYFSRVPSCGPLDGQTVTVCSSFGGSESAPPVRMSSEA